MSFIQFTKSIKLFRQSAGTRVDGNWVAGSETETTIKVSIQAASHRDILKLPEGERNQGAIKIYSDENTRLYGLNDTTKVPPDIIESDGLKYQIQSVEDWTYWTAIPHYKSIAILIEHKSEERA